MDATQCLKDEHQVILRVLDCFEIALRRSQKSGQVQRETYAPFIEFFRGFADKCHHCKEEDRLFPVLEKNGIPREGGPIGVMLEEHKQGRGHVTAIAEQLDAADGGDSEAARAILERGGAFVQLLRQHIDKEDHCLFAMAEQAVHGSELSGLVASYREAEGEREYKERFSRCRAIADELTTTYEVAPPPEA